MNLKNKRECDKSKNTCKKQLPIVYMFFNNVGQLITSTITTQQHLQLTSLHFLCLHFLLSIAFTSPTVLHFPNHRFENMSFTVGSSDRPFR